MMTNNIVIQNILGGLGNQMFQYAFIKALSLRNGCQFKLDISGFKYYKTHNYELEYLNIEKNYAKIEEIPFYRRGNQNNIIQHYLKFLGIAVNPYDCNEFLNYYFTPQKFHKELQNKKHGYFEGVFPSELYFKDKWDSLKNDFKFVSDISKATTQVKNQIEKINSVSIHVRRGNYLNYTSIYNILDEKYYFRAINIINKKVESPTFVFFSNDMEWTQKIFKDVKNSIFVSHNTGKDNRQDMYLMSYCKHNIIANSTFSWRGGYLNENPNKIVISPSEWFVHGHKYNKNDIIPENWIKIF